LCFLLGSPIPLIRHTLGKTNKLNTMEPTTTSIGTVAVTAFVAGAAWKLGNDLGAVISNQTIGRADRALAEWELKRELEAAKKKANAPAA
jgi:hypothetical protein